MKSYFVLAVVPALLFAGCTRVERETVVEKPVVEKETVVERPAEPRGCTYRSTSYSHGSMACQTNSEFRCEDGIWRSMGTAC